MGYEGFSITGKFHKPYIDLGHKPLIPYTNDRKYTEVDGSQIVRNNLSKAVVEFALKFSAGRNILA